MNFVKRDLAQMTNIELLQLADEKFNLELSPTLKKVELIDEILKTQEAIFGSDEDTDDITYSRRYVNPVVIEKDRVRVIFHETHDGQGHMEVKAGINGRCYSWKRNVEIDLPRALLWAMDNAKETRFIPSEDPSRVWNEKRTVPRYPYTIIADPAPKKSEKSEKKAA